MSPEDLLTYSEADLEKLAASMNRQALQDLFDSIWEKVRPLYVGQAKSIEASHGLSLSQVALVLAVYNGDQRLITEARHMMARSLGANEQFTQSIPFYEQTISGLKELGDLPQAARLHLALIGVLLNTGRYTEAFEVARVAEQLFTDSGDNMGLARLYNNVGNIYFRTDDHTQAYEYYLKSFRMFEGLGDQKAIALSSFNLGNALADIDQFEQSDEMYARAVKL